MPAVADTRRYHRRRWRNRLATALSIGAAAFGLTWLVLILLVLVVKGVGGLSLAVFTEMTPPPGGAGGLSEPDHRQPDPDRAGGRSRHPARHPGRDLHGRVWPLLEAHHGGPLHQRHSLERALDRRRPVRLRDHGRADGAFLRLGRRRRARHHRHSGRGAHHRGHAAARPQHSARGVGCARRSAMAGDPAHRLPRRARRHHHRRPARHRPHHRRDGAASVHRAEQPVLQLEPERTDGEPSRGHLPVCLEPLSRTGSSWPGPGLSSSPSRCSA